MGYTIESKPASKNGYHSPAEAKKFYGRYARSGVTVHWWGDPKSNPDSAHNNIVNYILGKARAGTGSVNYVLSNKKITELVHPDNVAWASQSGNPTTVSIEFSPNLNAEGYKKAGWLIYQLEKRYKRTLTLYPHKHWNPTQCPGTLSLKRMRQEADKWRAGAYNPKPVPKPVPKPTPTPTPKPPVTIKLRVIDIPNKKVALIRDANLWDLHFAKFPDAKVISTLKKGTIIEVSAKAYHPLGSEYYLSSYSHQKGISNGINVVDCKDIVDPAKTVIQIPEQPKEEVVEIPTEVPADEPVYTTPVQELEARVSIIESVIQAIKNALAKIGIKI